MSRYLQCDKLEMINVCYGSLGTFSLCLMKLSYSSYTPEKASGHTRSPGDSSGLSRFQLQLISLFNHEKKCFVCVGLLYLRVNRSLCVVITKLLLSQNDLRHSFNPAVCGSFSHHVIVGLHKYCCLLFCFCFFLMCLGFFGSGFFHFCNQEEFCDLRFF